jgi:hypothetical protein
MKRLILESWFLLLRFEGSVRLRDFKQLRRSVEKERVRRPASSLPVTQEALCHAIDYACILYFKPVLCLQRSAATTVLLRRFGWSAEMVIGVQVLPFKSHAWCEIEGLVVNDKPYVRDIYETLDRC